MNILNKKTILRIILSTIVIVALVAGLLGVGFISGTSYTLAIWRAIIFAVLFVIAVIAHTIKDA